MPLLLVAIAVFGLAAFSVSVWRVNRAVELAIEERRRAALPYRTPRTVREILRGITDRVI